MAIPLSMAGATFLVALLLGIYEDIVYALGFSETVLQWSIGVLVLTGAASVLVAINKFVEPRHGASSLATSKKVGEETHPGVAAEIIASHQHGGHHGGH